MTVFQSDIRENYPVPGRFAGARRSLWQCARRNFYYADDLASAAALCEAIIARFPLSEEADEARLLLHDIGIEYREAAGGTLSGCLYCPQDHLFALAARCGPCRRIMASLYEKADRPHGTASDLDWDRSTKISVAAAVTVLPIIGVAGGGVVGTVLPEAIALLMMCSLIWFVSKIKDYGKRILNLQA